MSRLRRMGLAFVFAVTMAGTILVSTPAEAATLPAPLCARLAATLEYLSNLAAQYPDSELLAAILAKATAAYQEACL
jgi:hypothetical protein